MTPSPAPRALAWAGGGALLVALAIANAAGYRYGVSDQAFYIPSILRAVDPTLYPRDAALLDAQARLMVSDEITAWLVSAVGLPLEPLLLAGHVVSLLLLFAAVWLLARRLTASPWTAAACCLAVTLRHRITETGANSFEGYYHPRGLAFAAGAWAAVALVHGRLGWAWATVLLAVVLHPTTGAWWAVFLYGATLAVSPARARRRLLVAACVTAAVGGLVVPFWHRMRPMDDAWIRPFASKDYVFPTAWPITAWLVNLLLPIVIGVVTWWRAGWRRLDAANAGIVAGTGALLAAFLLSLPFIAGRTALAVQLQTSRIFWVLDLLAIVLLVGVLAEGRRNSVPAAATATPRWRPRVVALVLLAAAAGRGLYIMRVEHPERAFVQVALEDSDWVRSGRWLATRTPKDTHVLADPDHDWRFGHSVRVTAQRDVLVEGVKDAAVSLYDREVAIRVQARLEAVGDFAALDAPRAQALAERFDLDVLVIDRDLPLPELHREGRFRVYRLR